MDSAIFADLMDYAGYETRRSAKMAFLADDGLVSFDYWRWLMDSLPNARV